VRYEDIPPEAIEKAKDCILDQVGVELIGSTLEWNKIAYRYVTDMGGRAESTIVNYGAKAPVLDAAFVNATFGQGCELDDVGLCRRWSSRCPPRYPSLSRFVKTAQHRQKIFLPRWSLDATSCIGYLRRFGLHPVSEGFIVMASALLSVR